MPPDEPASSAAATALAVGAFRGRTGATSATLKGATAALLVVGTLAIAIGAAETAGAAAITEV